MLPDPEKITRQPDGDLAPLYVVSGDELLLVTETVDRIRAHAKQQGYTEREIFTVDQRFDWANLSQWGRQSSLLSGRRVLDLRIPSGKPGKEGGAAIELFCRALPHDTVTVVTLPGMDKQGRASKWFRALEQAGQVIEIKPVGRDRLAHWIRQRLEQQNQTVDRDTLQFFANRVEGNLLAAHQEIRKLELLYPPGRLTFEQLKNAILDVTRFDVLQLPEVMLSADMARYSRILEGLQGEGMAPPLILAVLSEQIRLLIKIHLKKKSSPGITAEQAMTALRIWPSRQKLMAGAVQRVRYPILVQALMRAAAIDRIVKGVAKGDIWEELLNLGLYFTAEANANPAGRNGFLSVINSSLNK
ncbi:DNA polymerase III subunit delta [Nitrosomonas sp.]|uniref:DNA polymerase III subunit delta n=1 Tax=Nitrosomonas sp. TaxID=42353 RepID=UPI0025E01619|nr:DNA polymerase III subunit delta [Nitrosomonas sp.]MCC6915761.1 DNA polymerase III subunit delta [Nitrosomonas sp.]